LSGCGKTLSHTKMVGEKKGEGDKEKKNAPLCDVIGGSITLMVSFEVVVEKTGK